MEVGYSSNCCNRTDEFAAIFTLFMSLSIAQTIYQLMLNFSGVTRYLKKSKTSDRYKELETNFLQNADKLFDFFCYDSKQRKQCEIQYGLRMAFIDHAFF